MFLIELHCHTAPASACARMTVEEQLRDLVAAGYHGVVLTNHHIKRGVGANTLDAMLADYREACRIGEKLGIRVYFGAELRFESRGCNDYFVHGLTAEEYAALGSVTELTPESFHAIRPPHALFVQAHPFRDGIVVTNPQYLDGVEIMNGHPRHNSRNDQALAFGRAARETNPAFVFTSGSDLHEKGDVGHGGALFSRMPKSERELAEMLRRGAPEVILLGADREPLPL